MMFFQTVLLLGYGYTHTASTRLRLKSQLILHACLLALPLVFLFIVQASPFDVKSWVPPTEENPIPATLMLLAIVVGVPFFVVSTSAPLLQKWFSSTGHPAAKDPYFLYGASNLGSLLSLVLYPFLVEPFFYLSTQAWIWTVGYIVLAGLILACTAMVWRSPPTVQLAGAVSTDVTAASEGEPAPPPAPVQETSTAIQPSSALRAVVRKKGQKFPATAVAPEPKAFIRDEARADVMTWGRRLRWILLAAVPSSLMLGVTSYVSTDLSPFPLLWVIPLALYLITFILVFSKWPADWTAAPHDIVVFLQPLAICALCWILLRGGFDPFKATLASFFCFFIVALYSHGELAKDRPTPRFLTEYFLLMSVGGMVGGVFNGLFAPVFFTGVVEYPLAIVAACLIRSRTRENGWTDELILKTSPDFEKRVQDSGDRMSVAFGRQPRHSPYLLNYTLDIVLALLITGLAFWISNSAAGWGWYSNNPAKNGLIKMLKFLGMSGDWYQYAVPIARYFLPLLCCFFVASRPLRFGLAVGGVLLANLSWVEGGRETIHADRSYFGVLRVNVDAEYANGYVEQDFVEPREEGIRPTRFHYLMHGTTYHGRNYFDPPALSRLATTYYHRWGPVGVIMERYNWLPGPQNTFWADNRLPAGVVGMGATPLGVGSLPLDQIVHLWSEPPYATIGLGTGTMASYGRPYQHVVYYEIDEKIRNFNLPLNSRKAPYFTYLQGALKRGAHLEVIMGDARTSMTNNTKERPGSLFAIDADDKITQIKRDDGQLAFRHPPREKYYKVIVVDAFSSDAIPIHLITKEAIELYMSQLADDGVLCVHTSNRHMDLTKPVADIAEKFQVRAPDGTLKDYKLPCVIGHDPGSGEKNRQAKTDYSSLGHFSSEYVMLAWSKDKKEPDGTMRPGRLNVKKLEKILLDPTKQFNAATNPVVSIDEAKMNFGTRQWYIPEPPDMPLWTDEYSNIIRILR